MAMNGNGRWAERIILGLCCSIFAAGTAWGLLQGRIRSNERDLGRLEKACEQLTGQVHANELHITGMIDVKTAAEQLARQIRATETNQAVINERLRAIDEKLREITTLLQVRPPPTAGS
jgi:chromosome segregation ATPase